MDFLGDFLNVLLFTLWIFIFISVIMLVVRILMDIFRDHDLSGWGKTGWTFLIIVFPLIGALIYLIARGKGMAERNVKDAQAMHNAQVEYTRSLVNEASGPAADIKAAQDLLDAGTINQAEFDKLKAKALA
ncbi:PLDc N-terminal domain-containing protein [Demequina oxidasica]|uniref:PLDc N-terminal domain-containing protein n=1 Tax=Demequina oxidasica TaxID=676199 RepID=UPI0007817715|nr:PLDc N-terminal domain-containing protein [Demequina oxidasica]